MTSILGGRPVREVFISHASADDVFVAELRRRLEAQGVAVWVDSRSLRGGDKLAPEIEKAISEAAHVIVVISPATVNSKWVSREVAKALEVGRSRVGFRVVPVLLPDITVNALHVWFPEEPVAIVVGDGPLGLITAMPELLTALGQSLPEDDQPLAAAVETPIAELVLRLSDPRIRTEAGTRRATARAELVYQPADGARKVESGRFRFTAPLGPIEAEDLTWYLERYYRWPIGVFRDRACAVEDALPGWGRDLFTAAVGHEKASEALARWQQAAGGTERRFSVRVDDNLDDLDDDTSDDVARGEAAEAATALLSLPWELLHDGTAYLFQGGNGVRVRRQRPNHKYQPAQQTRLPVRILLVSPRPEKQADGSPVGYLDHRASALPLVEAVESLGELVRLTVLHPPTYAALAAALAAGDAGEPFDVVHFDGHGVYDRARGLGGLCFEQPTANGSWRARTMDFVDADKLAGLVRDHRVPLVFLEACQTAVAEADPTSSVAGALLDEGVSSVVAMTHSVLVETARRFVAQFYADLATGSRVGTAMLAGQRVLYDDPARGAVPGAGQLRLQDWFVPVLFQEELDAQPVTTLPSQAVQRLAERARRLNLGDLPEPPEHAFQGRSRDLLAVERHLHTHPWVVLRGTGGQGKTTLAVELVRWLVRTGRAQRAVFVPVEHHRDPAAVLDTIGRQLLGEGYSVAHHPDLDRALQPVERALRDQATIVLVDNCETLFPDRADPADPDSPNEAAVAAAGGDTAAGVFAVLQRMLDADRRTRVVFTSRESLPAPFADPGAVWELGALDRDDAVALVTQVLTREGKAPPVSDAGATAEEVTALVAAVGCHARALVLLARETARAGVAATTRDLQQLMARLEQRHPGDRENSLYASVALSLRRLPPQIRGHVNALAACHGGIQLGVLAQLTGLDVDAATEVARAVIGAGLGEDLGDGCLGLDPGLAPYLRGELVLDTLDGLRARWAAATTALTDFLYQQLFQDAGWATRVTLRLLPELLALLDWAAAHQTSEHVVPLATRIEVLVQRLGQPRALAHAVRTRTDAAARLGGWSHARFLAASAEIDRLRDQGQWPAAIAAAQRLLAHAEAGGEDAFPEAAYELARAHFKLGRVLLSGGAAEEALTPLGEARRRFQQLAAASDTAADRMAGITLAEIGDCLLGLGRWEQAADAYQEVVAHATRRGDDGAAAIGNGQLASVRLQQGRYPEALAGYTAAREVFEKLGEPGSVAVIWHQIGILHQKEGRVEAAEQAYQHSLALEVQQTNQAGQAATLNQLGGLYDRQGRLEEAVGFYRQAVDIYARSGDDANEGKARNNLADTLLRLGRHDQARTELHRALDCKKPYGQAAQPWTTWEILEELEHSTGHPDAAHTARHQAGAAYLAYRQAGGGSQSDAIQLFDHVARAITEHTPDQATHDLADLLRPDTPPRFATLVHILQALLAGDPEPARTDHPDLDPRDVVELHLLLAALAEPPPDTTDR